MPRPIANWRDVLHIVRAPDELLAEHLLQEHPVAHQLVPWMVLPLLVRPVVVFFRSLVVDAPLTAAVLATSSIALQLGVWLGVSALIPTLAQQFRSPIRERQAVVLTGLASLPLWLSGALFVVPESFAFLFWWSRVVVFFFALYGVFVVHRGLGVLQARKAAHWPLLVAITVAYLAIYAVLFTLLGLSSHLILFVFGAPS